MTDDKWPTEDVARLTELASSGLSGSSIASLMGRSRGAILGKINRLKGCGQRKPRVPKGRRSPRRRPVKPPAPIYEPVQVYQLQDHHCRWPLWGDALPEESQRFYCGAPAVGVALGFPYCLKHAREAFRAAHVPTGRPVLFWKQQ